MSIRIETDSGEGVATEPIRDVLVRLLADHQHAGRALTVILTDDARMRELHDTFLGIDEPTDCLSFPLADGPDDTELGEVYVSVDQAAREAGRRGLSLDQEVLLYAVHGTLHLLGYDDHDEVDLQRMREAERTYAGITGET